VKNQKIRLIIKELIYPDLKVRKLAIQIRVYVIRPRIYNLKIMQLIGNQNKRKSFLNVLLTNVRTKQIPMNIN
jgi:hypothetical protein